jgi:prepilin-type processing-associated H-X9-DG protein
MLKIILDLACTAGALRLYVFHNSWYTRGVSRVSCLFLSVACADLGADLLQDSGHLEHRAVPLIDTEKLLDFIQVDPRELSSDAREASFAVPYPIPGPNREPEPTHSSSLRVDLFPRPAETFLTFEVSNGQSDMANGFSMLRDQAFPSTWDAGWPHVLADIEPYRHGGCANYLFGDLHAASFSARILKARIDAGDNFSLIQR